MVEASMTLPVLILVILSVILVFLFFFESLTARTSMQEELMERCDRTDGVFGIERSDTTVARMSRGAFRGLFRSDLNARAYALGQPKAVRAGRLVQDE